MKKVFALIAAFIPVIALASESDVHLDKHRTDLHDTASLQRGAQVFANYCMGCHSLEHARYNRVARDLGIPEDVMMDNLVFADGKKFGDDAKTFTIQEKRDQRIPQTVGPGEYSPDRADGLTHKKTPNINMGTTPSRPQSFA